MQIAYKHKEKKLSEAQQLANILVEKWRIKDKAKAEIEVKKLLKKHPVPDVKPSRLSTSDPLSELERLTDLLDRGLINQSEFQTLKNRIFN